MRLGLLVRRQQVCRKTPRFRGFLRFEIGELEFNVRKAVPLITEDTFRDLGFVELPAGYAHQFQKVLAQDFPNGFQTITEIERVLTDSREALDAIVTFGTSAGLPPSIDTYHAAGFYEVTADNINAVNRSFLNLAKGAPAISDIST